MFYSFKVMKPFQNRAPARAAAPVGRSPRADTVRAQ
jgi:hypothetical protein